AYDTYYGAKEGDWLRASSGALQTLSFAGTLVGLPTAPLALAGNALDVAVAGREVYRGYQTGNYTQIEAGMYGIAFNSGQLRTDVGKLTTNLRRGGVAAATSFILAGDELGDALARNVGAFDDSVLPVRWNEKSQRWHAAADFEVQGQTYQRGRFVPTELGDYARQTPISVFRKPLNEAGSFVEFDEIRNLGYGNREVSGAWQFARDVSTENAGANVSVGFRSRPVGARRFDAVRQRGWFFGSKLGGADTMKLFGTDIGKWNFGEQQLGLRWVTPENFTELNPLQKLLSTRLAISDVDMAGMRIGGQIVEDQYFVGKYKDLLDSEINLGKQLIMHGLQADAPQWIWRKLAEQRGMGGIQKMLAEETIHIYAYPPEGLGFPRHTGNVLYAETMSLARYMVNSGYVPPSLFGQGSINIDTLTDYLVNDDWNVWQRPYWIPRME
ncbi:MAG: hypothetical protein ABIG63_02500, partial [Chloroflexota bacterium]